MSRNLKSVDNYHVKAEAVITEKDVTSEDGSHIDSQTKFTPFQLMLLAMMVLQNSCTVLLGRMTQNAPEEEKFCKCISFLQVTPNLFQNFVIFCLANSSFPHLASPPL